MSSNFMTKIYHPLLMLTSLTMFFASCESNDSIPEQNANTKVTTSTLMSSNGKRWYVDKITITNYSVTGTKEGEISPETEESTMWFGDNKGTNNLNKVFFTQDPLSEYLPGVGAWALNETSQRLTFTCVSECPSVKREVWSIVNYSKNAYGESINLKFAGTVNGKQQDILLELYEDSY